MTPQQHKEDRAGMGHRTLCLSSWETLVLPGFTICMKPSCGVHIFLG